MGRRSLRVKSRLRRMFSSNTNTEIQNTRDNKSKNVQEKKVNGERHRSCSPVSITPYVGQYRPLPSVPADQCKSSNEQNVPVSTLGKAEKSSKNGFKEDCSCGVEHSIECPQRYPLSFQFEQKFSRLSLHTAKTKGTECKPDEENVRSNPFNSSVKYCIQRKRKHFRSSTEIPLTKEELSALEIDINNPISISENMDQKKSRDKEIPRNVPTIPRKYPETRGKRHRFRSSTFTPLTEKELADLELDINRPVIDVLGRII